MAELKLKFKEIIDETDIRTAEDLLPSIRLLLRACVELAIEDELAENGEKETHFLRGG